MSLCACLFVVSPSHAVYFFRATHTHTHTRITIEHLDIMTEHSYTGLHACCCVLLSGGIPLQSHYTGIEKYTGVPEKDVLMAIWRSSPFLPAHYVCIDHAKKKIVVCIR